MRYSETASNELHAFLWTKGVLVDLETLANRMESKALEINPAGQVVGGSHNADGENTHATLWTPR